MYFGGSSGAVRDSSTRLIEHNLIVTARLGYNIEFKHQLSRNTSIGIPSTATTIVRHNIFSKETRLAHRRRRAAEPPGRPLAALRRGLLGHLPDLRQPVLPEPLRSALPGRREHRPPRQPVGESREPAASASRSTTTCRGGSTSSTTPWSPATPASLITGADPAYPQRVHRQRRLRRHPADRRPAEPTTSPAPTPPPRPTSTTPTAALGAGLDLYPRPGSSRHRDRRASSPA